MEEAPARGHSSRVLEGGQFAGLLQGNVRKLVVEVTEHAVISDSSTVRDALDRLRPLAALAIDDAGAGFASLRHILELKPDLAKLDASLVRGIERDPLRESLVAGLVHFSATAGCQLIGEAIETQAEAETLRSLGVQLGQGYFFGWPGPIEDRVANRD